MRFFVQKDGDSSKKTRKTAGLTFKGTELHQVLRLAGCVAGFDTVSDVMELSVLED